MTNGSHARSDRPLETGEFNAPQYEQQVEPNRRLVKWAGGLGVREFLDLRDGMRYLAMPANKGMGPMVELHRNLARHHVPVFPIGRSTKEHVLLDTPADARLLGGSLKFIARDVMSYRDVFSQLGSTLARCQASGLGLPVAKEDRPLLNSVAFSTDDAYHGSGVYLVPPYNINTRVGKQDTVDLMAAELDASPFMNHAMTSELVAAVNEGWNAIR